MVAMGKKAWFALMNWKTRMGSPRSPVRTRLLPLPGYRAPGAVAGSHAADGSAPRARRWSGRPVRGPHRDQPDEPSSRSPGRSVRTRATAPPVFAQIGPEQPSVAGIPAHRVGDSSASMTPPSQMQRCPPNRVNSSRFAEKVPDFCGRIRFRGSRNAVLLSPSFYVRLYSRYKLPDDFLDPGQVGPEVALSSIAIALPIVRCVQKDHQIMNAVFIIDAQETSCSAPFKKRSDTMSASYRQIVRQ